MYFSERGLIFRCPKLCFDSVAAVDEHVHLVEQNAVGVLFGEGLEGDEVHGGGIVQDFNEKRAGLVIPASTALFCLK